MKSLFLLPILLLAFWGLYQSGLLVWQSKRAVHFLGSDKGNRASFASCTGTIRRKIRFSSETECTVTLLSELEKGELEVELLSENGTVFLLRKNGEQAAFIPKSRKGYTLIFRFQPASGNYSLHWN